MQPDWYFQFGPVTDREHSYGWIIITTAVQGWTDCRIGTAVTLTVCDMSVVQHHMGSCLVQVTQ